MPALLGCCCCGAGSRWPATAGLAFGSWGASVRGLGASSLLPAAGFGGCLLKDACNSSSDDTGISHSVVSGSAGFAFRTCLLPPVAPAALSRGASSSPSEDTAFSHSGLVPGNPVVGVLEGMCSSSSEDTGISHSVVSGPAGCHLAPCLVPGNPVGGVWEGMCSSSSDDTGINQPPVPASAGGVALLPCR